MFNWIKNNFLKSKLADSSKITDVIKNTVNTFYSKFYSNSISFYTLCKSYFYPSIKEKTQNVKNIKNDLKYNNNSFTNNSFSGNSFIGAVKLTSVVRNKDKSASRSLLCVQCTPFDFLKSEEYKSLINYLKDAILKSPKGITLLCTLIGKSGDKIIQSSFTYSKMILTSTDSIDKLTEFVSNKRDAYNLDYILLLKIRMYKH